MNVAIKYFDFVVLNGHRNALVQNELHARGVSKVIWPHSKHNKVPSKAVDIAPYPIDWNDTDRFYMLGGFIMAVASLLKVPLRWGGDWDGDTQVKDQNFFDLGHFELDD